MSVAPAAFATPVWTLARRRAWVAAFERAVSARRDELCRLMHDEVGKDQYQALGADVLPLLASCRWHARRGWKALRPRRVGGTPLLMTGVRARVAREPIAPWDGAARVAIIATWNYPVQLLGIQLVQAILAGNRVVVKPSEFAPRTQALLLEIARAAGEGLPPGVLEWTPATREAGRDLLAAGGADGGADGAGARIAHVVFTGSTRVGRQIAAWCAENLVASTLELSGADSAFVLADADVARAAASVWDGVVVNAGQTCMAPRRVLVERGAYAGFIAALAPLAAAATPVRLISPDAATSCHDLARAALCEGGRSLSGVLEPPDRRDGRWWRPVAVVDCPARAEPNSGTGRLLAGAHFGPLVAVVPVADVDEALAVHGRCEQHLSASLFTRDAGRARALVPRLGVSQVCVNACLFPSGHPALSLGGRSLSGWGESRGTGGLLALTRPVAEACVPAWWPRVALTGGDGRMVRAMHLALDWFHGPRAAERGLDSPTVRGAPSGNGLPRSEERAARAARSSA